MSPQFHTTIDDSVMRKSIARELKLGSATLVTVYRCPLCGIRAFAGFLGPGTTLTVRCEKSNCAHNPKGCGWTASEQNVRGQRTRRSEVLHCPSAMAGYPWTPYKGDHRNALIRDGRKTPCRRPWAFGTIGGGTRIKVWCRESTCICHNDGFIIIAD